MRNVEKEKRGKLARKGGHRDLKFFSLKKKNHIKISEGLQVGNKYKRQQVL